MCAECFPSAPDAKWNTLQVRWPVAVFMLVLMCSLALTYT